MKVRVICINDKNRPNEIPVSKWITKGEKYHITWIYNQMQQKGIKGVELAERDISDCIPFNCFNLNRFAIHKDDTGLLMDLFKECTDYNDTEILSLMDELSKADVKELSE